MNGAFSTSFTASRMALPQDPSTAQRGSGHLFALHTYSRSQGTRHAKPDFTAQDRLGLFWRAARRADSRAVRREHARGSQHVGATLRSGTRARQTSRRADRSTPNEMYSPVL